jgi:hypothetical protein
MASPDHRKQRQTSALGNNIQVPLALNFEQMREDINMDMGGNDEEHSVNNGMCTVETPTVLEEEISITGHDFTNNDMDYTNSPIPTTTTTATNQSNGEFTPVLNGSPNRQSSLERRNTTTTTTNNRYSALQTTSTTKESNNNNNNTITNLSAKDRHDNKND